MIIRVIAGWLAAALWLTAATGWAAPAAKTPQASDESRRLQALERRLTAGPTGAQALLGAFELAQLAHHVPGPELARALQRVATSWRPRPALAHHPAMQVIAGIAATRLSLNLLDLQEYQLRAWQWLGPLGDEHGSALARHDGVEAAIVGEPQRDGPAKAPGRQGDVTWQPLPAGRFLPAQRLPLSDLVDRPDDATIYLSTWLRPRSQQATAAVLRLGTDGGARIWLSGVELPAVTGKPDVDGLDPEVPPLPAVARVPLALTGGWQRLVVKLAPAGASLGLLAEVVDAGDVPLAIEVTATRPAAMQPPPRQPAALGFVNTLDGNKNVDVLAGLQWGPGQAASPDVVAALMTMAWRAWPLPAQRNEQLLNAAVEDLPPSPQVALAHSMLPGETGDRIDRLLQWRARLPHDMTLLVATAAALDEAGKTAEAVRLWTQWATAHDREPEQESVRACRVRVGLWTRMSADRAATALLRSCTERWPQVPSLRQDWARHLMSLDLWGDALAVLSALALAEPNADYAGEALTAALAAGDLQAAHHWLEQLGRLAPWRTRGVEGLARAELESRQPESAQKTLQRAPEMLRRTAWHELAGDAALALGQHQDAERHFRVALALSPARADLRARLLSVSQAGTFYASQRRDLVALAKKERTERRTATQEHRLRQVVMQGLGNGQLAKYEAELTYFGPGASGPYQAAIEYPPSLSQAEVLQAVVVRADGRVDRQVHQEVDRYTQDDSGMYFDLERITLTFADMHPGDAVVVEHEVRDLAPTPFGLVFGELVQLGEPTAVRESDVTVLLPQGRTLYWTLHHPSEPHRVAEPPRQRSAVLAGEGGPWHEWRWRTGPYPAVKQEERGPAATEQFAYLHVSSFASWTAAAHWYAGLMAEALPGRGQDPVIRELAQRLARGKETTEAKVRAVYDHVRSQVRYVGLEFGIHSIKPHGAREVAQRQFGDCKDKATLIVALLAELGIDAELALVRTRDLGPLADGQASLGVFNHAIAYVPTMNWWLDATATWHGPRELPLGDAGGTALRIAGDGEAKLAQLPQPDPAMERDVLAIDVQLRPDGGAAMRWALTQHGLVAAELRSQLGAASSRKERLEADLAARWPGAVVGDVTVRGVDPLADEVTVEILGDVPRLGTLRPSEWLWAPLRPGRSLADKLATLQTRKTALDLRQPIHLEQHMTVRLPPGWRATRWPAAAVLSCPWGDFKLDVALRDGVWTGDVTLTLAGGRVAPAHYPALRAWLVQVDTALRAELALSPARSREAP